MSPTSACAFTARTRVATVAVLAVVTLLLTEMVAPVGAGAHHPELLGDKDVTDSQGLGVDVNSPKDLADFFPAVQWAGTPEVDDETAQLVYAGTGCTPASYAPVAAEIQGNIAVVDSMQSETNPADQCPASTFFQKVRSAQHAGAIGFIHIPAEGEDANGNATAVAADIPALEVDRTDEFLAVRDAAIDGEAEATLTDKTEPIPAMSDVECVDGQAGPFECDGIDLLALMPQDEFNGAGVSDLWGWTDPEGGEYVIMGKTNGVAFFDVTEPTDPVYLGELPNPGMIQEVWHDIKVYDDHAFIVSESEPHGMTVFDLTRLRDLDGAPEDPWDADAHYRMHSAAHNLEINTDTGTAYIVGGNAGLVVPDQCLSGLHMVDIDEPTNPTFEGCYLLEGGPGTAARSVGGPAEDVSPAAYVHDAQCVLYEGPDERYHDREICLMASEDKVVIADVTDKVNPTTLGVTDYPDVTYAHQGWLSDDGHYWFVNDELDEDEDAVDNTRTIVLDVSDLEEPTLHFEHFHETVSPDHNNYVHEGLLYQSNYSAGLRVLDTAGVADGSLEEIAFFDTFPTAEDTFDGTWSNYPFFESGTIAVSGRAEGLFLLRLQGDETDGSSDKRRGPPDHGEPKGPPEDAGPSDPAEGPDRRAQADDRPDTDRELRAQPAASTSGLPATPATALILGFGLLASTMMRRHLTR